MKFKENFSKLYIFFLELEKLGIYLSFSVFFHKLTLLFTFSLLTSALAQDIMINLTDYLFQFPLLLPENSTSLSPSITERQVYILVLFVGETPKNISDSAYAYQVLAQQYASLTQGQALPPLERSPMGKPFFPPPLFHPYGHFNLSHSKGLVAVALGTCPVGVDIQVHKTPSPPLIQRVCSWEEQQWLSEGGEFSLLWVMKEAYIKCKGEGIGTGRSLAQLGLPLAKKGQERQILSCPPYTFHLWSHSCYSLGVCLLDEEATTVIDLDYTDGCAAWSSPP